MSAKRLLVVLLLLAGSASGCGMFAFNRQVVVNPATVDDFRSPAWIINSPPAGGRLPTEDPED